MIVVTVSAPCRLHFGMFSFGHSDRPQFGGVGMMIEPPTVDVRISPADFFTTGGTCDERVRDCVTRLMRAWNLDSLPLCKIDVRTAASHIGLGVGTQLGLSIAAGLRRYLDLAIRPAESLAADVGRGLRSAVGTYGFREGGVIIDHGKLPGERLGTLHRRLAIPVSWRIVLVRPLNVEGLSGNEEAQKFTALPAIPDNISHHLWRLTSKEMLPALEHGDCVAFGDAVYRFGRIAGDCFAAAQGGPFASRTVEQLVEKIRDLGVTGVGQSSWGPTVFAITRDESEAKRLVDWLSRRIEYQEHVVQIARPNNCGATIESHPSV